MVYGTAFYPLKRKDEMSKMEFADSKQLSEDKRDKLFEKMNTIGEKLGWAVNILSPNLISNSMLKRSKYNLNELSHDTAIGLIRRVKDAGILVKEVYVDTVGPPEKYEQKLVILNFKFNFNLITYELQIFLSIFQIEETISWYQS